MCLQFKRPMCLSALDSLTNTGSVFVWERNSYHFNCSKIKWSWSQFAFCMVAINKPKKTTLHCILEKKEKIGYEISRNWIILHCISFNPDKENKKHPSTPSKKKKQEGKNWLCNCHKLNCLTRHLFHPRSKFLGQEYGDHLREFSLHLVHQKSLSWSQKESLTDLHVIPEEHKYKRDNIYNT